MPRKPKPNPIEKLVAQGKGWVKLIKVKNGDEEYLEMRLRFKEYQQVELKKDEE
jgi:hypothetical protein